MLVSYTILYSAARLLAGTSRTSRRSQKPVLLCLHWLPLKYRIDLILYSVLTYRGLHGQAPGYISDLLTPYTPSRALRSAAQTLLLVSTTHLTRGVISFQAVAQRLWSSLPRLSGCFCCLI